MSHRSTVLYLASEFSIPRCQFSSYHSILPLELIFQNSVYTNSILAMYASHWSLLQNPNAHSRFYKGLMRNRAWKEIWKHRKSWGCPVPYFLVIYRTTCRGIDNMACLCTLYTIRDSKAELAAFLPITLISRISPFGLSAWYSSSCQPLSPLALCEPPLIHHNTKFPD